MLGPAFFCRSQSQNKGEVGAKARISKRSELESLLISFSLNWSRQKYKLIKKLFLWRYGLDLQRFVAVRSKGHLYAPRISKWALKIRITACLNVDLEFEHCFVQVSYISDMIKFVS